MWPVDPQTEHGRVTESESPPPPKPGHTDTLTPNKERLKQALSEDDRDGMSQGDMGRGYAGTSRCVAPSEPVSVTPGEVPRATDFAKTNKAESQPLDDKKVEEMKEAWDPKPPKVLMDDASATPLELRSQIQLYATNEYG